MILRNNLRENGSSSTSSKSRQSHLGGGGGGRGTHGAKRKPKQRNYPRGNTRIGNRRRRRPEEKRHGKCARGKNRRTFFFPLPLFLSTLRDVDDDTNRFSDVPKKVRRKKNRNKKHGPRNRL
uniref:(northern house mosquito) hypothetical protein n=1 Tax=Culex pipiens TaxID=7175 RepID=A0A8D8NDV2_CULPI